ncbi:MAG: gluconate 2-dehydrogenase subunit 3 family protein [Halioglobus sp.]
MDRREFLQCAAILVTGVSASQLGFSLTAQQQTYLATAPNYNRTAVNYFSDAQRKIIAAMAERIIPRTDTPGAIDAGVPQFIELMAADWLNEQESAIFKAGLADMEKRIPAEYGAAFDQLDEGKQVDILEAMEDAASGSPWYEFGNVMRDFISDAPFICQVKELTIWGFFTSELGATQVLRYDAMPMKFDGELPLGRDDSSWSVPTL